MPTSQKMFAGALWFLLIAVIILFWTSVFRFSYNFPYYDDFENIVKFIQDYSTSGSIQNKLALLFEQNFEHRVVFSKSVTLLQYFITGQVNIKWLIILGDLSLVGILFLLFKYFRQDQLSLPAFFAIGCLLFQGQHYEDTISWATCSLQHAPCIFFSLWSFYLALTKRNVYFSGSLAILALFTSANGLSSILIWLVIVFLNTRDKKKILIPAAILVLITIIHIATLKIYSGSVLAHATSNIGPKIILFFSFAGQLADPNMLGSIYPSVILGLIFTAPILIICANLFLKNQQAISSLQWFCIAGLLTLLFVDFLIVFARGTDADPAGYRMDRYKIYAAFFAVLSVAFYDGYFSILKFAIVPRAALAAFAFLFCITSYYVYYGNIVSYRKTIEANHYNFLWSNRIYYPIIYWDAKTGEYMSQARHSFLKNAVETQELTFQPMNWKTVPDQIAVQGSESTSDMILSNADWRSDEPVDKIYAVAIDATSSKPAYLFTVDGNYQKAAKMFLTRFERPLAPGFSCRIYKTKLKKGTYDLYLLPIKKGRVTRPYKLRRIII